MPHIYPDPQRTLAAIMAARPVMLAPMEDVSDSAFRAICRELGADLCFTEFVNVDGLLRGDLHARRKITIGADDHPIGIQIYGSDPRLLAEAAQVAAASGPLLIDINCGCWVPKIARRGAGAGWLRDISAMAEMVAAIVRSVDVPVTVKTRIGWSSTEIQVPELVRRLEDAGVAGITLHCRTAVQRHEGEADWTWAALAQQLVHVPVIVNGGIDSATHVVRALEQTGCAGVMVARAAIGNPWIFREAQQALAGAPIAPPTITERLAVCARHLRLAVELRPERAGVCSVRRHFPRYLLGLPGGAELRRTLHEHHTLVGCLEVLDYYSETIAMAA